MKRQKYDYDLIVLGSGCGSLAAHIAAGLKKRVALVESDLLGGECPNWGCVPSKALLEVAHIYDAAKRASRFGVRSGTLGYNYPSIKAWRDLAVYRTGTSQVEAYYSSEGIDVIKGEALFTAPHEVAVHDHRYSAEYFLIATGTHNFIPPIDGLDKINYVTFKEAGQLTRPPKSLFIVGAGNVGCEYAELFSIFGTKVYLSDITPRIMAKEDQEASEQVRELFEGQRGMNILTNAKVLRVTKDGLAKRVHYQKGNQLHTIKVDEIMIAAGKLANVDLGLENAGVEYTPKGIIANEYMQTSAKHIYAAGDVTGPYMLTHVAIYQSRLAANNMFHKQKIAADYRAVPRVTYLEPEVASVGMSDDECTKRDLRVRRAVAPISITSRANTTNTEDGFVKVITNEEGMLLGATIVCPRAGEMIHELALAIQMKLRAADIATTMHAFPTWSEAVRIACNKVIREG